MKYESFFTTNKQYYAATSNTLQFLSPTFKTPDTSEVSSSGGDEEERNEVNEEEKEEEEEITLKRSTRSRQASIRLMNFVSH